MYGTYNISNCPATGLSRRTTITEYHATSVMVLNCFTERLDQYGTPIGVQGIDSYNVRLTTTEEEFEAFKTVLLSGNADVPAVLQSVIENADTNGRFN